MLSTARVLLTLGGAFATTLVPGFAAAADLEGRILDAASEEPVAAAQIRYDDALDLTSSKDGSFTIRDVSDGPHRIAVSHPSYVAAVVDVTWPGDRVPLVIRLEPSTAPIDEVTIRAPAIHPSFPVSAKTFTRDILAVQPGNIANDPLRTVQAEPSAAPSGIDFNSVTAIRGGDPEEHRVFYDGFPLDHYAHTGGFTPILYDDLLESTTLVPGGAPLRYRGNLSGVILFDPIRAAENSVFARYDITSMAVGGERQLSASVSALASAKTSFFNLPAYQPPGVDERSFRDALARVTVGAPGSTHLAALVIAADDEEIGVAISGVAPRRDVRSFLGGLRLVVPARDWTGTLRVFGNRYHVEDDISARDEPRDHLLTGAHGSGEIERRVGPVVLLAAGTVGLVRHEGRGGLAEDTPYDLSVEAKALLGNRHVIVVGAGGSREPWTEPLEPEAYASVTLGQGGRASLALGLGRSHQTPFVFTQPREFATIPIDAGDLLREYRPSSDAAKAVESDQAAVRGELGLTSTWTAEASAWWREYRNLPTWAWSDSLEVIDAGNGGDGSASGYEFATRYENSGGTMFSASLARAKVDKKEGSLAVRRPGDFDMSYSLRLNFAYPVAENTTIAVAWQDREGRPFTVLDSETFLPDDEVNAHRLAPYRRFDVKLAKRVIREHSEVSFFLDVLNLFGRENTAMIYSVQLANGEYVSGSYEGVTPFPIVGLSAKW
jgi:hypothetical protein